ncbi:unnamed protein product, partial [Polarella glacialis]
LRGRAAIMGRSRSSSRSCGSSRSSKSAPRKPKESGTVNSWNTEKQFGFVSCDGNRPDIFCHAEGFPDFADRDVVKSKGLRRGDRLRFDVKEPDGSRKKLEAMNVQLVEDRRGRRDGSENRQDRRKRSNSKRRRSPSRSRRSRSRRSRSRR